MGKHQNYTEGKEEARGSHESDVRFAELEEKLNELGEIIIQQSGIIKMLGEKCLAKKEVGTSSPLKTTSTKPRDIPILQLRALDDLESAGKLNLFFDLVEQCTPEDEDRVKVEKTSVSSDLATMLIHTQQGKNNCQSWGRPETVP